MNVSAQANSAFFAPDTASQGIVTGEQIQQQPAYRVGETLEVVPGLIVTQHSGEGKANQYFLRGFNLDHAPISISRSTICRSTCAPMRMAKAMPISIS
jgi:outer membrane cobalamin receptor